VAVAVAVAVAVRQEPCSKCGVSVLECLVCAVLSSIDIAQDA